MMTVLLEKVVKIRKVQSCWGCLRKFEPGSMLRKVETVEDGAFLRVYWCGVCTTLLDFMLPDDCDGGFEEGALMENEFKHWQGIKEEAERMSDE